MLHIIFIRIIYRFCGFHFMLITDSQVKNLTSLPEDYEELFMRTLALKTTSCELLESSTKQNA